VLGDKYNFAKIADSKRSGCVSLNKEIEILRKEKSLVDAAGNMNTICLPRLYVVVAGLASEVSGLSRLLV